MTDDTPAEVSFRWRRIYTFAVGALSAIALGFIIAKVADADALKWIAIALIAENVVVMGCYMMGASLVDWARLMKAWRGGHAPTDEAESS